MSEKTYHIAVEQATARRPSGHELRERDRERRRRLRATSSDVKEQERRRKRRAQEADSGFREREQVRKQQYRDQHQRPFVGVDGEGGDTGPCASPVFYFDSNGLVEAQCPCTSVVEYRPTAKQYGACKACGHEMRQHRHQYWLLRAGEHTLETGHPLTYRECFPFLASLDPAPAYVGYFFNYDVWEIVAGLPKHKLEELSNREKRASRARTKGQQPFPVDIFTGPCADCNCADHTYGGIRRTTRPVEVCTCKHNAAMHRPVTKRRATRPCAKDGCSCPDYAYAKTRRVKITVEVCTCEHDGAAHRDGYLIDFLPNHFFKIKRTDARHWVEINDVGSFFQQPFVNALEEWKIGTGRELDFVGSMKHKRDTFGRPDATMRRYNQREVCLLAELMEQFRTTCADTLGRDVVKGVKWQGPGRLAESLLKHHGIPKAEALPYWDDAHFKVCMNQAYVAGRFETSAVGEVTDHLWNNDINSAYPHGMTKLPCLMHGTWTLWHEPVSELYIARGRFRPTEDALFYGLPVRGQHGGITFPASGGGTYWSFEIAEAKHQEFYNIDWVWNYHRRCDCEPFDWVPALYAERLRLGKTLRGKMLKLVLNSLYGKLAQRVGAAPYNNTVWSSFITAHCRTQVMAYIHSLPGCQEGGRKCGDDVYAIATDSVTANKLPKKFIPSKQLGGWDIDAEHRTGMFLVQPGVYFVDTLKDGERMKPKTRGMPRNLALEHEHEFRAVFRRIVEGGPGYQLTEANTVTIPVKQCISLRLALAQGHVERTGQWKTIPRHISFDWSSKRAPGVFPPDGTSGTRKGIPEEGTWRHKIMIRATDEIEHLRTFPPAGSADEFSLPYDERWEPLFDRLDMARGIDRDYGQPDWTDYLDFALEG